MSTPSLDALDPALAAAAREAGRVLRQAGFRAWIVGGALRDLALGRAPKDVDLATDAVPDEVERLFARTIPVGKAFGTIVVPLAGLELQVTSLRRDAGYSDARRPDAVAFGSSVQADAARRDFTCNALYMDLEGETLVDPVGGLADLHAGRLRAVGDAAARFREDGLRLLRLARFAASYELTIEEHTWRGAAASLEALRGVSSERVLAELQAMAMRRMPGRAVWLLGALGALERLLPDLAQLAPPGTGAGTQTLPDARDARLPATAQGPSAATWRTRAETIAGLGDGLDPSVFLSALLAPADEAGARAGARAQLASLRPSRALAQRVGALWELTAELRRERREGTREPWRERAASLRLVRAEPFQDALRMARAQGLPARARVRADALAALAASTAPDALHPEAYLTSEDLEDAGVPRGPAWGRLLLEAEDRRLGGADASRADALRWLHAQALAPEG